VAIASSPSSLAEGAGHSPVVFGRVEPAAAALGADHVAHDDDRDPHLFGHVRRLPFPLPGPTVPITFISGE